MNSLGLLSAGERREREGLKTPKLVFRAIMTCLPGMRRVVSCAVLTGAILHAEASAELFVGGASISITPKQPVALSGQMHTRISRNVESPVIAVALALESRQGNETRDQAIMVACDLVAIRQGMLDDVRQRSKDQLVGFDVTKMFLSATHTHTAPESVEGRYDIPEGDVMRPAQYHEFLVERLAEVVVEAWNSRVPGKVGWGLGHAVVAQNRRAVYSDGRAQMYGPTDRRDFRGFEGYEDHDVNVLCFWDSADKLIATAVNVACPAQEVEGRSSINADFWHPVREKLQAKHGAGLLVLGWTGAAGDQSPHLMYRKAAEERMRKLRGLDRLDEIALRIVAGWDEAYEGAKQDIRSDAPLAHTVRSISLPMRKVTDEEAADAQSQVTTLSQDPKNKWRVRWHQAVIDRHARQTDASAYTMELHTIRVGDVAIATNDFELFTEYGLRIKARSRAVQTFLIQLAGSGGYLPTDIAVRGGGYSAIIQSSIVGPEGGQALVDHSVESINRLMER
jgi:hypothetical protein